MPTKEDPLEAARPPSKVTLWLNRENMAEARENYWQAYNELYLSGVGNSEDHHTWQVAFAAAVAAFDYMMSGKITP